MVEIGSSTSLGELFDRSYTLMVFIRKDKISFQFNAFISSEPNRNNLLIELLSIILQHKYTTSSQETTKNYIETLG